MADDQKGRLTPLYLSGKNEFLPIGGHTQAVASLERHA